MPRALGDVADVESRAENLTFGLPLCTARLDAFRGKPPRLELGDGVPGSKGTHSSSHMVAGYQRPPKQGVQQPLLSLVAASNRVTPLTAKDSGEVLAVTKLHRRLTADCARNKSLREKTETTMYGGGLAQCADDQDADDGASVVSSTADSASDTTSSGQKRKVEPLSDAQLEELGTPPPASVIRICKQGFPLFGSSQFSDRKKIMAAGGEWNKTKKMWKAKDVDTLNSLLRTHAWRPAGVSQQHYGLLAEGFEYVTKYNAALAEAQRVKASQKRVRTEEEEDADRRAYLGIPNITDKDKADFKKEYDLDYEDHRAFVKKSTKLPELGPRSGISDLARVMRGFALEIEGCDRASFVDRSMFKH